MTLRDQAERKARQAGRDAIVDVYLPTGEARGVEWSEWAPIAGQVADWATTSAALRQPGVREGNPILASLVQRPLLFLAVKSGAGLVMGRAVDRLNDEAGKHRLAGDPVNAARKERWARRVSAVFTLLGAGPALSNAALMYRRNR